MEQLSKTFTVGTLAALTGCVLVFFLLPQASGMLFVALSLCIPIGYLVYRFDLFSVSFFLLAVSAPFSVNVELSPGNILNVPFEPLSVALFVALLPHLISRTFVTQTNKRSMLPPLFLLTAYVLSAMFSTHFAVSLKFISVQVLYITVFYFGGIHLLRTKKLKLQNLIYAFSIGFMIVVIYAFYLLVGYDFNPVVKRGIFRPFFNDHTIFSAVAAMLIAYSTGRLWFFKCRGFKTFFTLAVGLAALILSGSRGGMISLIALLPALFITSRLPSKLILGVSILVIAAGALTLPQLFEQTNLSQYQSHNPEGSWLSTTGSVFNTSTDVSNIERLNRWYSGLKMLQQKPVTGFGPGTYQFEYIPFQNPNLSNRLTVNDPYNVPEGSGGTAHSELILLLSECGIPGFTSFMAILSVSLFLGFKGKNTGKTALLMLVTYLVHMQVNNFLDTGKFAIFFWTALAAIHYDYEKSILLRRG